MQQHEEEAGDRQIVVSKTAKSYKVKTSVKCFECNGDIFYDTKQQQFVEHICEVVI